MGGVKGGGLETAARSTGAPNTGHDGIIPRSQILLFQAGGQGSDDRADQTA